MGNFGIAGGTSLAPFLAALQNPQEAFVYHDDFFAYDGTATVGGWITSQHSGGGTAAIADGHGGIVTLNAGGTSDEDGPGIQTVNEFILPGAGKRIYFETYLVVNSAVASSAVFFGLADHDTTVFTTNNARNLSDYIGFYWDPTTIAATGAGYLQFAVGDASGEDTSVNTTGILLVAGTWVRLGFMLDYDENYVDIYKDGTRIERLALTRANIPATELAPTFCLVNEGTAATGDMDIDYVTVACGR